MKFKEIASRLTGFSVPVFGVSWNPHEPEIAVARRVLAFLEDRRVLFNPYHLEVADQCVHSVVEIRHFLTEEIGKLSTDSKLADHLRAIRAACRKFLNDMHPASRRVLRPHWPGPFKQNHSQLDVSKNMYWHSLTIDIKYFQEALEDVNTIVEKTALASHKKLFEYIKENKIYLTEERQKALDALIWSL